MKTMAGGLMALILAGAALAQLPLGPIGPNMNRADIKRFQQRLRRHQEGMMRRLEKAMTDLADRGLGAQGGPPGIEGGRPPAGQPNMRLGAELRVPGAALAEQLELPKGQGLLVNEVGANSAGRKAGLKQHDILLELDGKPVPRDVEGFRKQLAAIKAGTKVKAVVMRKGRKETLPGLVLPAAKEAAQPARPGARLRFPG